MDNFPYLVFGRGARVDGTSEEEELVALPPARMTHAHIIGKTGSGKSTLIASQFVQLLWLGLAGVVIDPSGVLSKRILRLLLEAGYFEHEQDPFSRLVYLNLPAAARQGYYLPFNVLQIGYDPHTAKASVLEAFRRAWPPLQNGTASNIELLIKVCAYVLAVHQLPLFPFMRLLLTSQHVRERLLADIADEEIHSGFALYGLRRNGQVPASMQATIRRFISFLLSPLMRYSFGQQANVLNFKEIIERKQSVVVNLNVGDPDAMRMLGCMFTVFLELAGNTLVREEEDERPISHKVFIDEFQNFVGHSEQALETMATQMRKAGLFLGLAHQSMRQIPSSFYGALLQCGIRAVFTLDRPDAEQAAELLDFPYNPFQVKPRPINILHPFSSTPQYYSRNEQQLMQIERIMRLEKAEAFVQLPRRPLYQLHTLHVRKPRVDEQTVESVEAKYRERYFRSQAAIEAEIKEKLRELGVGADRFDEDTLAGGEVDDLPREDDEYESDDFYDEFRD